MESHNDERMKNEWMNPLPPKFHLEGSISRCLITSRGEEFHLSSLSEAKVSVESQNDEKMRNEWEGDKMTPRIWSQNSILSSSGETGVCDCKNRAATLSIIVRFYNFYVNFVPWW